MPARFSEERTQFKKISQILRRQHPYCAKCYHKTDLHVHHIVPLHKGGTNSEDNLIVLCAACHAQIGSLQNYKDFDEGYVQTFLNTMPLKARTKCQSMINKKFHFDQTDADAAMSKAWRIWRQLKEIEING